MVEQKQKQCSVCRQTETLVYKDKEYWYNRTDRKGKLLCRKCYMKIILNPRINARRMVFQGKRRTFPFTIRQNKCKIIDCNNTNTDRHHIEYVTCFPLAMTIELCDSHHREENRKQEEQQRDYYFDWNRTVVASVTS